MEINRLKYVLNRTQPIAYNRHRIKVVAIFDNEHEARQALQHAAQRYGYTPITDKFGMMLQVGTWTYRVTTEAVDELWSLI